MAGTRTIALLTDFGLADPYVGAMKGAILSVNPRAAIVDISHDVPAHDVSRATYLLQQTHRFFPRGTVFVAVVDPEVGGERDIVAVKTKDQTFLAPDNGLLGFLKTRAIHAVTQSRYFRPSVSRTFHGRDIFAPVAAHLSRGLAITKLGPRRASLRPPADTTLRRAGNTITGEVISVDRFGNLVTNIPAESLDGRLPRDIRVGSHAARQMVGTYADAPPETLVGLIGSGGTLELALREQSAAARTGAAVGDAVTVKL